MPWTKKQKRVAQAVEHGWKPKGKAKGFTKSFAHQVLVESTDGDGRIRRRTRRMKTKH